MQFIDGDPIVKQGEAADSLYLIKSGNCIAYRGDTADNLGKEVARMSPGGVFGESALQEGEGKRQASVVASGDVTMLKLTRSE